jgi:hypothetical protein
MNNKLIIPIACLLMLLVSCRKEKHINDVTFHDTPPIILVETSFRGKVIDESGAPVSGANVFIYNSVTSTDAKGNFNFNKIKAAKGSALVRVEKPGFFASCAMGSSVSGAKQFVKVTMLEKGAAQILSADAGATLTWPDGSKVTIKPQSVRYKNGSNAAYSGQMKVFAKWIDPSDSNLGAKMPGALMAIDKEGKQKVLSTYGMIALDLESADGQALEIMDGQTADLELPIPAVLQDEAPAEAPLWAFDLELERWYFQTTVCIKNDGGNAYNCDVPGTGYWNVDVALEPITLSGTVFQSDSTPAYYTKVIVEDLTNNFTYWGYTAINGFFSGSIPKDVPLKITIEDLCGNVLYTQEIGPYAVDTDLGNIYLNASIDDYLVHFSGQLQDCNGLPIPLGQIAVVYPGRTRFFVSDANGVVDFNLGLHCVEYPELQVTGYDLEHFFATPTVLVVDNLTVDLGTMLTCIVPEEYFKINTPLGSMSLTPTRFFKETNSNANWMNLEGRTIGGNIFLELRDYHGVGQYTDVAYFSTNDWVELPDYIKTAGLPPNVTANVLTDDGQYIIGVVSGTIYNNYDPSQPISMNGEFKIKKEY